MNKGIGLLNVMCTAKNWDLGSPCHRYSSITVREDAMAQLGIKLTEGLKLISVAFDRRSCANLVSVDAAT